MAGGKTGFERGILDILDHSCACNPLHDITGALLTDGSMLAHIVEGPSAAVTDLHVKLMRDKRHNGVLVLQYTLVHVRLFDRLVRGLGELGMVDERLGVGPGSAAEIRVAQHRRERPDERPVAARRHEAFQVLLDVSGHLVV